MVSPACVVKARAIGNQWGREKGSRQEKDYTGISGEKGLWSVAEEAFLPRGAFEGSVFGGGISFVSALLEAVAIAVHLQDVNVVGEPVQQSAGQPL